MAKKETVFLSAHKPDGDYSKDEVIGYVEGPLCCWQAPDGWLVAHVSSGLGICGNTRWKQKKQALAYLIALLEYEEDGKKIDCEIPSDIINGDAIEYHWKKNDVEFLKRAYKHALKAGV